MSTLVGVLTALVLLLPLVLLLRGLPALAAFVGLLCLWTWVWMRPTRFELHRESFDIVWPLRRWRIPRSSVTAVRCLDARAFRRENGIAVRIGVGGLWGGFGWLWTRAATYAMYVSRSDDLVLIHRPPDKPLLITPERASELAMLLEQSG